MKPNLQQSRLIFLLALVAVTGLTAYAYRTVGAWRRATDLPPMLSTGPTAKSGAHHRAATSRIPVKADESAALAEPAQSGGSYTITQAVIAGGGGISANGTTSVTGSAGQSTAAASSGGIYSVSGGFWQSGGGGCPAITVSPVNPNLPSGTMGVIYSQVFTQSGGNGTLIWSNPGGGLPGGLALNGGSGILSGTPTTQGTFNFNIRVTDAANCTGEQAYTLFINAMPCPTITVNPSIPTLTTGTVGVAYSQSFTQTGGNGAIAWSTSAGSLPNGLSLNVSTGVLSGTPTAAGTANFTLRATDGNSCVGERAYTLTINAANLGLQFFPLPSPVRLLDTRNGAAACSQPNAPITGGASRLQPGRSICTIPANAAALTGNITTVQSGGGFLTLYPSGAPRPTVASTNYGPNEIINNVFTVGLGADGAFNIFANATTDVVVDVTGYYAPPAPNGLYFHPLPRPLRLLETRVGQLGCISSQAPLLSNTETTVKAGGIWCILGVLNQPPLGPTPAPPVPTFNPIPSSALAIVGNATTVGPQGGGFLTIFPADAQRPLVASSNYNFGQIVNGPFSVGLDAAGQFKIFTVATTDLVVDVLGYYSTEANDVNGAGLLFYPLPRPVRLLETRPGEPVGCFKPGVPLNGNQEYTQPARGLCDNVTVPTNALAVVGNATVVLPNGGGFLTLWPSSAAAKPLVATANYNTSDVVNRHFIVGLGNADGAFKLYSFTTTNLVIDLSGYFAP